MPWKDSSKLVFERVAERNMPYVVQERRYADNFGQTTPQRL
jgi:hypothetical protein